MMEQDERSFNLSIAGHSFAIRTLYDEVYYFCRKYITDTPAEVEIKITEEDIANERENGEQGREIIDAYLEKLAVYRKIAEAMLDFDVFLMHGAVIAYENAAYMFTAASGTGKTTHIRKWLKNLDRTYVVNGDKPLIKITDNGVIACGTPWRGKERLGRNCMVPLKAIVLIERGENNKIKEITFENALVFLLRQTYMPEDVMKKKKTLALVSKLKGKVRFYKFECNNMKCDAFEVAYNGIVEK